MLQRETRWQSLWIYENHSDTRLADPRVNELVIKTYCCNEETFSQTQLQRCYELTQTLS